MFKHPRLHTALVGVLGGLLAFVLATLLGGVERAGAHPTTSGTITTGSPWEFRMDNAPGTPQIGMRIRCNDGENGQCLEVDDYGPTGQPQPIFAINKAGGLGVFGDMISGFDGPDIFNYQLRLDPVNSAPPSGECLGLSGKYDRIWIGGRGSSAGVWQCKVGGYGFYWSKIA